MTTTAFRKFKKSMDAVSNGRSAMESYDLHAEGTGPPPPRPRHAEG